MGISLTTKMGEFAMEEALQQTSELSHIHEKGTLLHNHSTALEELIEKIPGEAAGMKAAELFSFLSDSTRLRILWLLCHSEECVTDIAAAVSMSPPAVSHHLRLLKQAGLIKARREGKEMLYSLEKSEEATLVHKMVDDVFDMQCPECSL